jgi:hypothetical protein
MPGEWRGGVAGGPWALGGGMCWEGEIERVCTMCMVALRRKCLAGRVMR